MQVILNATQNPYFCSDPEIKMPGYS